MHRAQPVVALRALPGTAGFVGDGCRLCVDGFRCVGRVVSVAAEAERWTRGAGGATADDADRGAAGSGLFAVRHLSDISWQRVSPAALAGAALVLVRRPSGS